MDLSLRVGRGRGVRGGRADGAVPCPVTAGPPRSVPRPAAGLDIGRARGRGGRFRRARRPARSGRLPARGCRAPGLRGRSCPRPRGRGGDGAGGARPGDRRGRSRRPRGSGLGDRRARHALATMARSSRSRPSAHGAVPGSCCSPPTLPATAPEPGSTRRPASSTWTSRPWSASWPAGTIPDGPADLPPGSEAVIPLPAGAKAGSTGGFIVWRAGQGHELVTGSWSLPRTASRLTLAVARGGLPAGLTQGGMDECHCTCNQSSMGPGCAGCEDRTCRRGDKVGASPRRHDAPGPVTARGVALRSVGRSRMLHAVSRLELGISLARRAPTGSERPP